MTRAIERPKIAVPPEIVDDLTRREFLIGAGLIALAPGCGSGESGEEASSADARVIEHKYGSTEVSGRPERVVVVGLTEQDAVLALGVVPVGTTEWYGEHPGAIFPWAEDELGDGVPPEIVGTIAEANFEAVAAMEPDLILGLYSTLTREQYETLSEIAPTIAQSEEYGDYGIPWQALTRTVGRALDREARAEEAVAEVEERIEAVREAHPEFEGASGVVAGLVAGNYFVYGSQNAGGGFRDSLGFENPEEVAELAGVEFGAQISRERLDLTDADATIWLVDSEEDAEEIKEDPIYSRLDVAREGRDVFLAADSTLYEALTFGSILSIPYLLENLVPMLAAVVDGDPETEAPS